MSAEQYPVAEKSEPGAAVHLPLDHLGPGVNAFGAAVVVREGDTGGGGLDVQVKAAGKGVHAGQVRGVCVGDPLPEPGVVARVGS